MECGYEIPPGLFPVEKGQFIAYNGTGGYLGGPTLPF